MYMGIEVQNKLPVMDQAVTCLTGAMCAWVLDDHVFVSVPSFTLVRCIERKIPGVFSNVAIASSQR